MFHVGIRPRRSRKRPLIAGGLFFRQSSKDLFSAGPRPGQKDSDRFFFHRFAHFLRLRVSYGLEKRPVPGRGKEGHLGQRWGCRKRQPHKFMYHLTVTVKPIFSSFSTSCSNGFNTLFFSDIISLLNFLASFLFSFVFASFNLAVFSSCQPSFSKNSS